jgi:hypothetical protein
VTADGERSKGYGGLLFDWIMDLAAREGCLQVRLVSNVRRVRRASLLPAQGHVAGGLLLFEERLVPLNRCSGKLAAGEAR